MLIKVQTMPNIPVLLQKKLLGKFHWATCIILSLELGFSGFLKITYSPPMTPSQRIYFSCVDSSFYLYALAGQSYFQGLFGLPELIFFLLSSKQLHFLSHDVILLNNLIWDKACRWCQYRMKRVWKSCKGTQLQSDLWTNSCTHSIKALVSFCASSAARVLPA